MRGPTVEERAASPALAQNLVHLDWAVLAGQAALTQLALSQHQQRGGAGRLSRFVPWRVQLVSSEAGVWVYAPVTERGEALGVLELLLADPPDPQTLGYLRSAARALSYIVIADRRHSDLYECGQRTEELSLEAEIQRRLLPPSYSCQAEQFALAACLVPANQVGGDTFDDIVDRDTLYLSFTDAMGRGGAAARRPYSRPWPLACATAAGAGPARLGRRSDPRRAPRHPISDTTPAAATRRSTGACHRRDVRT